MGQIHLARLVSLLKHTTINLDVAGRGQNWSGDGEAAAFCSGELIQKIAGGVLKAHSNCNQVAKFDHSAWLLAKKNDNKPLHGRVWARTARWVKCGVIFPWGNLM